MNRSAALKAIGAIIALAGAWTAIIPFVGPTFGYGMPPGADVPAWEWNASHFQRHVIPGVAAVIAGALIMTRSRGTVLGGAYLGALAGIWMIINPFVVRAWLEGGGGGGGGGGDASTTMQIITPLGYHHVPGIVALGLAAFTIGWVQMRRRPALDREHAEPAGEEHPGRFDREPARDGAREGAAARR